MKSLLKLNFKRAYSSLIRSKFSEECEKAINKQITKELQACHNYLAMAFHFDRSDVASPGVFKFLKDSSLEEYQHAKMFMVYMNKRGGTIKLEALEAPTVEIHSINDALVETLRMENDINDALLEAHAIASKDNDPNMCDFIEANFLQEQIDAIKIIGDMITQVKLSECDLGNYLFDKYILTLGDSMHNK